MTNSEALWAQVRGLPARRIFVEHEPDTPRYQRARDCLDVILSQGLPLGVRRIADEPDAPQELALWVPPLSGRGSGAYVCLRVYSHEAEVTVAVLFCFYDGTEKSPVFRSYDAAVAYARDREFKEVNHD